MKVIAPVKIGKKDAKTLVIHWNDGSQDAFDVRHLRLSCPCAACVNEWTGAPLLDPDKVDKDVVPTKLLSVGRYAMAIHWSDGHRTGIYSYDYLKKLA